MVKRLTNARERSRRQNCSKAEQCQGCPLISMDYAAQLHFKHEKVARALAAYPELTEIKVNTVLEAPRQLGYRSSAKLAIGKERGKVKIGLYRRNTHQVIDIGDCPLHHPLINEVVAVVREEIERQGVFVYRPDKDHGLLRYLVVRVSPQRNEAMVTFVTRERCDREVIHLAKWLVKKVPTVVSVHQNINTGSGNAIWGNQTLRMMGHPSLLDQVGDLKLRIGPNAFFQVNHDQAERIYQLAREWAGLSKEEEAVDLYCGIGGIALNLARDARAITGVEVVQLPLFGRRCGSDSRRPGTDIPSGGGHRQSAAQGVRSGGVARRRLTGAAHAHLCELQPRDAGPRPGTSGRTGVSL
jgi:23S rRNA (uracil1939-C5)-methyltransferase